MIDLFRSSVVEVFSQNFGIEPQPCESHPVEKGYIAQIPFTDGTDEFIAQLWIEKPTLKELAGILLFDENPDEETLKDLTAELANFIVGHAKMAASDRDLPYQMQTPTFLGVEPLHRSGRTLLYRVNDRCLALQLKEKNG